MIQQEKVRGKGKGRKGVEERNKGNEGETRVKERGKKENTGRK